MFGNYHQDIGIYGYLLVGNYQDIGICRYLLVGYYRDIGICGYLLASFVTRALGDCQTGRQLMAGLDHFDA